jgi:ribonucleoside-diphosphate reductase alpha chain
MDYIFRWMQIRFLSGQQQSLFENFRLRVPNQLPAPEMGEVSAGRPPAMGSSHAADALRDIVDMGDAPSCSFCGSIMTRNGSCYRCMSCGSTSGCS